MNTGVSDAIDIAWKIQAMVEAHKKTQAENETTEDVKEDEVH